MAEWHKIETAPIVYGKAGFSALLYVPGINDWQRPKELPYMVVGAWNGSGWVSDMAEIEWYESTGHYIVHSYIRPTHWMPLPPNPS